MDPLTDRTSWMYRRGNERGEIRFEYREGVEEFLNFAFSHEYLVDQGTIRCPCRKCGNMNWANRETVTYHLYRHGFMPRYYVWTSHGESPPQPRSHNVESLNNDSSLRDKVYDVGGPTLTYQVGCESDDTAFREDPNAHARQFFQLLQNADEKLYPGCEQSTFEVLNLKSELHISSWGFNRMLAFIKRLLPKDNNFPQTFYDVKKMMKSLGLGQEKIDVCENFCMIYYKDTKNLKSCLICKAPRYKYERRKGKKLVGVPQKVMRYLPLRPRLERLFMSRKTCKLMSWHASNNPQEEVISHPAHGEAWKTFDAKYEDFAQDSRNVRLGLFTDGFNPFGFSSNRYSCWPVITTVYNLPPWMCMTQPFMFLTIIMPEPDHPGKHIDIVLRPLIDELKLLWDEGIEVYDVIKEQNFILRAALMWTISDFPAYGMLSGWSTHGRLACPICREHTKAFTLKCSGKQTWFDCQRQFLPPNHPYRRQRNQFLKNRAENDPPPPRLSGEEMKMRVDQLPEVTFGF